ncbi:unnamed protein product [Didymodactylos carnosus]|uniref:Methyltransferase type 11 domain-containing protein n=1 Tax=Didymodactylos carnosus TaxID=1234261 RepID=A0A8S2FG32_9BILA|nr:unnamed protein product [Didymodactylos carnosus]CAF4252163.1 unnamed protein product [Didymodactylos carnosus]
MNCPLFVESNHTANYKAFRLDYPQELYKKILEFYFNTTNINLNDDDKKIPLALDVACGSGQATVDLSYYCHRVIGIDGSQNQLKNATLKQNIEYQCHNAENITFLPPNSIDLITVATALHWFNIQTFFEQVNRILKPNSGVLSIWSLGFPLLDNPKAIEVQHKFSHCDLDGYWSDKIQLLTDHYESILDTFPYQETRIKHVIEYEREMSILQFVNMIETWSACQTYRERHGQDKLKQLLKTLADNLAKCYTESSNDISSNKDGDAIYDKKMIVKWIIHLHLMKKQ